VPGSVNFNESFANFVGEAAADRYVSDKYGADSGELAELRQSGRDYARFEGILHGLYEDLDTLYRDPGIDPAEKAARKAALYASLESRVLTGGLENPAPYVASIRRTPWNNARLMQFQTYNSNEAWFATLLARDDGDIHRFITDIGAITRKKPDPFVALEQAAGAVVQNP
jgi:predicted aminopeptidase